MFKVTRDTCANIKLLKKLAAEGYITIFDVNSENYTKKISKRIPAALVWDVSTWDGPDVFTDGEAYDMVRNIIGKDKIEDARKLEAHIRARNDYFITEDRDFLDKRNALKKELGVVIYTPTELNEELLRD